MPALLHDLQILYSSYVEPFRSHTCGVSPRRQVLFRQRAGGRRWVTCWGAISVSVCLAENK
jgi:hypothetical protein